MGDRPTHGLVITDKSNTKRKTRAGVLFKNELGGMNLRLNPGVVLRESDQERFYFTFWPLEDRRDWRPEDGDDSPPSGPDNDDIPF